LKELEKIAPKEKGIVQGTVKDVIQSLVDDGMVDTDKIGTSIYFWAFPSKATNAKKQKLEHLENSSQQLKKLRVDVEAKLAEKRVNYCIVC
jgi:predicted transcriptional regulator